MIPYLDLAAQYASIRKDLDEAVLSVLHGGDYVLGRAVEEFERDFASYCGATHAVAVNTGTSALHLALLAAGIGPGDEVITVPATFVASVAAILYAGARPVLVDIDARSWTMDPAAFAAAITPQTKAVIPVHLHGRLSDMDAICRIAKQHGLVVIEDAAQAHGAERSGRHAGTFGEIGCFSFYPGKNLGACGEGGALITSDAGIAEKARCLRDWGQRGKANHVLPGYNYRMDGVQGAVLGVKLRHLPDWTRTRRQIAAFYSKNLAHCGASLPLAPYAREHAWHVYAVRHADRDLVRAAMSAAGIATAIHYPTPVHLQPAYVSLGYRAGDFPIAEAFATETLSLPVYPEMTQCQLNAVVEAFQQACWDVARRPATAEPVSPIMPTPAVSRKPAGQTLEALT